VGDIDDRIARGADAISRDLEGPAGQIALDRVVARHLGWFALCQGRGMTWRQIVSLLHAAGAGRAIGLPFSHSHLSAVVWRQRQKANLLELATRRTSAATRSEAKGHSPSNRSAKANEGRAGTPARPDDSVKPPLGVGTPTMSGGDGAMRAGKDPAIAAGQKGLALSDVRAFMKRAADVRRRAERD
jgi:hypothetical protein